MAECRAFLFPFFSRPLQAGLLYLITSFPLRLSGFTRQPPFQLLPERSMFSRFSSLYYSSVVGFYLPGRDLLFPPPLCKLQDRVFFLLLTA